MHCHLFAEGAKVLTRKSNERMAAMIAEAMNKLCRIQNSR